MGMPLDTIPEWMMDLDGEDSEFIRKFILSSGSLKEMAQQYGVTYPTVRLRLDKLIQKIRLHEEIDQDSYIALIKRMAIDGSLDFDTAKILISSYRKSRKGER